MNKALKTVLALVALAAGGNIVKESMKASSEVDARIRFEQSCARQAHDGGKVPEPAIKRTCSCTADQATKTMGGKRCAAVLASGNEAAESDRMLLNSALASCLQEHAGAD
jgi:hypothetical protein